MTSTRPKAARSGVPAPARLSDAANMYLGWLDASRELNGRAARVARVWIDEALGVQRDIAQTTRRVIEEMEPDARASAPPTEDGQLPPSRAVTRLLDLLRSSAFLWTEAGLKVMERYSRVAEAAIEEVEAARRAFTRRIETWRTPPADRSGAKTV